MHLTVTRAETARAPAGDVGVIFLRSKKEKYKMAIIFKVKDGPRGSDRTDSGRKMSTSILESKLKRYNCRFLSKEPPQFRIDQPSDYYQYIVIEVTSDDEVNQKFPKSGFYLIESLNVDESGFLFE